MRNRFSCVALALIIALGCGQGEVPQAGMTVAELLGVERASPQFILGGPAPVFSLPIMEDGSSSIGLDEHLGRVVVLNFWNTGCVPCIREHETLNEVADEYRMRGVDFVGIMADDVPATLARFAEEHSPTVYPNLRDRDEAVSRSYKALGVPLHVVIDRAGNVAWWELGGPVKREILEGVLDDVLSGKRPTAAYTSP